ncbi:BlaI/MecI/CopY family transcriptional regulator [Roseateles puraquae]|uniref:BlaI/MecI/CopY family transcriptional regulator n=1 Tax=Roseateles puraquae TaxID=431059 RepID=UPI0031D003A0
MSTISDAESQIMRTLWARHPLSAEDVLAALPTEAGWQLGTVKTLLNRLLNKGALQAERDGRRYLYEPRVAREQWEQGESLGLLDRVFDGRLSPLVAHFSAQRRLSAEDAEALRRLLREHDDAA